MFFQTLTIYILRHYDVARIAYVIIQKNIYMCVFLIFHLFFLSLPRNPPEL